MSQNIVITSIISAGVLATGLWIANSPDLLNKATNLARGDSKAVLVLFDLSGSTRDMRDTYDRGFEKILTKVGAGDRIIVERITDRPLTEATFPVNEEFAQYGMFDQRGSPIFAPANKKDLDAEKEKIKKTVKDFLNSYKGSEGTAILDSLQLAERVFTTYPDKQKVLVIFSDMVEIFGSNNFTYDNLKDTKIAQIIASRQNLGQLPNLNSVKVYVVGAGAGAGNRTIKSQRWFNIENFWLSYFAKTGADLTKDRYGSSLLDF